MQENDTPRQDTSEAPPVEQAPGSQTQVPESETPATPAHEEAQAASGQPGDDVDYSQAGDAEPDEDDQLVEGDDPEPAQTDEDPGNDDEVSIPAEAPAESFEADPEDQHGASDHPES